MVLCWAPGCNHYNQRETCKFFIFPKDPQLRNKWKTLVRRNVEPGPGAYLCSCHFPDGKRENKPQFFKHNQGKRFQFSSPEKRKRKRHDSHEATTSIEPLEEVSLGAKKNLDVQPSTSKESSSELLDDVIQVSEMEPQASSSQQITLPLLSPSSVILEAENYFLQQEMTAKDDKLKYLSNRFSYESIKNNNEFILLYTGLPSGVIFESLFELVKNVEIKYYFKWNVDKINRCDQLLMTLMKLRHNFPHLDLAQRFGISQAAVSNIIITWVHVLHEILYKKLMATVPSRKKNRTCLPNCCSTFTNCRIILDCTEVFTAVPRKSMTAQRSTYSSYKHRNTWKGLIGVAPNGVITYISALYPGSTSDKKIVHHCGILEQLVPGDLVLADKGFLIRDILPVGVALNLPPFLTTAQFTPEQVRQTECIARARIHVERAIRRMKVYKILNFIPNKLIPYAEEVFQTVGALTNLQYPLIKEVEQYYTTET